MNTEDLEAKTIATYDATAADWSRAHATPSDWEGAAKQLKELLPAGRILEVGCGGGRDAAELIKLGYDYFGTDASIGMVKAAQQAVPGATFQQVNVYDLAQLPAASFDGFWACAVLLHIPKGRIDEALQALNAPLKPGAIGMISIKDGNKEDFEVRDNDQGAHEERLFVYWSRHEFTAALERNGFAVLEYEYRPVSKRTNWHIFFVKKT